MDWLILNALKNCLIGRAKKRKKHKKPLPALCRLKTFEELESRDAPSVGGGFTGGGIVGQYFDNTTLSGTPAFTRTDVRIDFNWGTTLTPGGSISAPFNSVGHNDFSVLWTGDVVPAFSETYTFTTVSADGVQLFIRPAGTTAWTALINDWTAHSTTTDTGAYTMRAESTYDIKMEYFQTTGTAVAELGWSSPSVPYEIIDVLSQTGINNPDLTSGFTNLVQGARNSWLGPQGGGAAPGMDANGWPTGDGGYVFQESLNQGLGLDPLMQGTIAFSFNGSANVSLYGNANPSSLTYSYDAADNTTTGSFVTVDNNANASIFFFSNSHRNGTSGPGGLTNLELMRPTSPGATTSYNPNVVFDSQILNAMSQYTIMRFQLVANQQVNWSDRTLPTYFNQANGNITAPHYGNGAPSNDGPSWEYEVMLANETGRDLMLSIPPGATGESPTDTTSYIYNLANLLKYGSNAQGVPYTSYQANPYYPGLEPNLRVYLELGNELWNYAGVFATDFANINSITAANAAANNADFQIINYDNLSTAQNNGSYVNMSTWRYREIMLRMYDISNIFKAVWGSSEMMTNIRPLYEWQYNNQNDTASIALTFADNYFDNGDGIQHVANPEPISAWLWGGGGGSYYSASNSEGLTTLLPDNEFAMPDLSGPGFVQDPSGSPWTFTGTAGIAQAGTGDIPPAFSGDQMGYITGDGSMSVTFTAPATQTSSVYGISFTALNAPGNSENIRLYLDGRDITADTVDQTNGYTPTSYNASEPWDANNVYWTTSQYYYTVSFNLTPGSTHTITIKGMNVAGSNQTVFLGDVQVTSVDAIFASSIPGGGQATGQPGLSNLQAIMNVEVDWALAYGLQTLSYEGGWSLGGDDDGSWVQNEAKYGDPRAATVQEEFMQDFAEAGSAVNVMGTYSQWPSWSDYYAQQGLLNISQYPIIQGMEAEEDVLPAGPTNGIQVPAALTPATAFIANNANQSNGQVYGAGSFLDWNIIAPQTGTYAISLTTTGIGASVELLVDGQNLIASASGGVLSGDITLTKGLHSVKVQDLSATGFDVSQIIVAEPGVSGAPGAPAAPSLTSAVAQDGAVALSWTAVSGAAGYEVAYGASAGNYGQPINVGMALNDTVSGLTDGQTYYFVAYAYNSNGLASPPSAAATATPIMANGQITNLVTWNVSGEPGNETTLPVASAAAEAEGSAIVRGPYLGPMAWPYTGDGAFASDAVTHAQTLAGAESLGEYYQFSAGPADGYEMSLSGLQFLFFAQNQSNALNDIALAWSTDGVNFTIGPALSMANNFVTANLSGIGALQNTTAGITFRIYTFGEGNYETNGFYGEAGNDVVLSGAVAPTSVVETAPTVTMQPQSQTINNGGTVTLTAAATGVTPQYVQWQISTNDGANYTSLSNGGGYSGVNTDALTISYASAALNNDMYWAVFTNQNGSTETVPATLQVKPVYAVADFPGSGLSLASNGVWTSLGTGDATSAAVDVNGDVVAAFGSQGVSLYTGGTWTSLSKATASQVAIAGNGIVAAEFPGYGLYLYENGAWQRLATAPTTSIAVDAQGDVVGAFGDLGVYFYEGATATWTKIANAAASQVAIAGNGIVAGEFPGYGLFEYQGGAWTNLTTSNATSIAVDAQGNVVGAFGSAGVYLYQGGTTTQLSSFSASIVGIASGAMVAAEVPGAGVFLTPFTNPPTTTADASLLSIGE
jgi:hypothetical protein